jgi:hypothetical protein
VPELAVHPRDTRDKAIGLQRSQDLARLGIDLVDAAVVILADPQRALGPGQSGAVTAPGRRRPALGDLGAPARSGVPRGGPGRAARLAAAIATGVALAALPKCPLCLAAYLSAIGAGAASLVGAVYPVAGFTIAAVLIVIAARSLAVRGRSRRRFPVESRQVTAGGTRRPCCHPRR